MDRPKRRISYAERTIRAWCAILLCYVTMMIGIAGPMLAIDHWYFEPLCQRYATVQEAVHWWGLSGGSELADKRCTADGKSVNVAELGGTTAVILHNVGLICVSPFGMVLGLIAGALLWQRISAIWDWLMTPRNRIANTQHHHRNH